MKIDNNDEIGQKIFQYRKNKELTRAELGKIMNLHESTIKRYEDGDIKNISTEKIIEFSKALNISPMDLLGTSNSLILDSSDNIFKIIEKYTSKIAEALKNICIHSEINIDELPKKYFVEISQNITIEISELINYKLYNTLFLQCHNNFENFKSSISVKDIYDEVKSVDIKYIIENQIISIFINAVTHIYSNINNIEIPKIENKIDTKYINAFFEYYENINPSMSQSIIYNIEQSEIIHDISDDIVKIIENKLFYDIYKIVLINFIKQLNMQGKEMALEYIKYLLTNDLYKETN